MPNFQTHWVIAWEALKGLAGPAAEGRKTYEDAGQGFAAALRDTVAVAKTVDDARALHEVLGERRKAWAKSLGGSSRHEVTCFSAFMLGAVGPDFWMAPADNTWCDLWDAWRARAPHHFDLGHYNRTHQQFRRSFAAIGTKPGEQEDLERAYFCGMATHIAADLFIHQWVNTIAGAYNAMQDGVWSNEHGHARFSVWNMHNKVEQYLDGYMRYRFLGDLTRVEPIFGGGELDWFAGGPGAFEPAGLPLIETLIAIARRNPDRKVREALLEYLEDRDTRILVERPLVFPAVFCDHVLGGKADPFVYERVVSTTEGAYPKADVREDLLKKATHSQMRRPKGSGYSEEKHLRFFSGPLNDKVPVAKAWNYLAYIVGPDLARIRGRSEEGQVNGRDRFYDLAGMRQYGAAAVQLARKFANEVAGGYAAGASAALRTVGRFWNLDTGNGLEVQALASDTPCEVITRLDFLHVLDDRAGGGALGYPRADDPARVVHLRGKEADPESHSEVKRRAFPVVPGAPRFASLKEVAETKPDTYLDRIRVGPEGASRTARLVSQKLDDFFSGTPVHTGVTVEVPTVALNGGECRVEVLDVRTRLTIEVRIAVPDFGETRDEPGMFFYCDEANGLDGACAKPTAKWLDGKGKLVDFAAGPRTAGPLRQYTARILTNLVDFEPEAADAAARTWTVKKDLVRVIEAGRWNNVIGWKDAKQFYGRNFAIGTGRRFVLRAVNPGTGEPLFPDPASRFGPGDFSEGATPPRDPSALTYLDRPFPTEHTFFTLYPLVRAESGKVYDAFSKEPVDRKRFDEELRKLHMVGWMKIVLLYVKRPGGASQLDRCFVDALETEVAQASA